MCSPNPTIENIEDARTVYLAHQCQALIVFGGRYGIPHGIANASLLPRVLRFYGSCVYRRLAQLADLAEIGNGKTEAEKAILYY